jgi:hypothetical protein
VRAAETSRIAILKNGILARLSKVEKSLNYENTPNDLPCKSTEKQPQKL